MLKRICACLLALTLVFTSVNFSDVEAAKVRLNKTKTFVRIGKPIKLKVKNTKKKIKWKTTNKKIATVSKKGVVKGKKYGKCYIVAKVGKKKLKCRCIVTHKVAKKISAKSMSKIAKKIKSKGSYKSDEGYYEYSKRFMPDKDRVFICKILYYPKTNHIVVKYPGNEMECEVELHVGDNNYCNFYGKSYENNVYAKGTLNKLKMSEGANAVNIIESDVPDYYFANARTYIFNYVDMLTYMFDEMMKELKTDVYSEDMGFSIPLSEFK
ncbi:MAG: Ig-like domain-containing protein [Eubacterium sp.]|nr:Ig-like domain-containing protein [Eubacterium sp.]